MADAIFAQIQKAVETDGEKLVKYPVQKYRTRINLNASLALQILFARQICITKSISHAE